MTEEEARDAIVKAALARYPHEAFADSLQKRELELIDAVDAYREATKPEPFEAYVGEHENGSLADTAYPNPGIVVNVYGAAWRCTVTPVERVR